jgi:hypothetical protein
VSSGSKLVQNILTGRLTGTAARPVWFIATLSAAESSSRRDIIRATWQSLYNRPELTFRFVLSNAGPEFTEAIEAENTTYGDIVPLSLLGENHATADSIPLEFFSHLVSTKQKHAFVTKIDDDSFLNVPAFRDKHLASLLTSRTIHPIIFARPVFWLAGKDNFPADFVYPAAPFYTLSWDLVEAVVNEYSNATKRAISEASHQALSEDVLLGNLLRESGINFTFLHLPNREAFEYAPWLDNPDGWGHRIAEGAVAPQRMRNDDEYLEVARVFDSQGLNLTILGLA